MKYLILFILLFYSCNSNFKKSYKIGEIKLYELQCSNQYYLSLENCDCKDLPKNYFIPVGEKDSFFEIFIKENKGKLQVNSLYNKFITFGNIEEKIDFIIHTDNASFMDSIEKVNYTVIRGYINGRMNP
ncbi:hypothetical protein HX088_01645 [Empedobacter sp. 225-1]|uniref:hypothetical protein n=1 Tax=unclassified Empedobacter TaxID=2643773 RepID=UPI002575454C|nr:MULTISPECIES: hypothetical protein [unclassified Empedobacter]MDM1521983.1 hypothetical protein [Empedobacter sp. 225-1]MDM1542252.1 hypothetical protein [Empedobacter sp. 189-2]